ncbi:MAG TPA: L-threonylcarbamoyladenylate synthase [Candidatus Nanopelagicales bacterium]|nr:L-threonylcarbamoyladenylate synthase [Candidatus Nanopelagicales bacterium]
MSFVYRTSEPDSRRLGLDSATSAVRRGELVVLPTDTAYGVGTDAFHAPGIERLLAAKGRGRDFPLPVLVGSPATVDGLTYAVSSAARRLVEAFWPGALTVVVRQAPSLAWDIGDAAGKVALRMPLHPVAIELLRLTGPLAVTSANRSGAPVPMTAAEAQDQLGEAVTIYLDAGPSPDGVPSTIVDASGEVPVLLRAGAIDVATLREVCPDLVADDA